MARSRRRSRNVSAGTLVRRQTDELYSRKIDVGHMRMSVPPGIVEDVRKMMLAQFGNMISARRTMIPLPGGYVPEGAFQPRCWPVRAEETAARHRGRQPDAVSRTCPIDALGMLKVNLSSIRSTATFRRAF